MNRYTVTGTGGSRNGCRFAVLDRQDAKGGMRRVSWHRTFRQAKEAARKLNRKEAA